jgi:putative cell wall-binding protein
MKRILQIFVCTLLMLVGSPTLMAQDVEMADTMRSEGKIYVIVAIILIVLAGLIFYLFTLDRKIKKIENSLK